MQRVTRARGGSGFWCGQRATTKKRLLAALLNGPVRLNSEPPNDVLLHLGHLPAASTEAGRVKRLVYPHPLQIQLIERSSSTA
jgi:hypothetical protein